MNIFSDEPVYEFSLYSISPYCGKYHWDIKETFLSTALEIPIVFLAERNIGKIDSVNCFEHVFQGNANGLKESIFKRKLRIIFGKQQKYESFGNQKAVFNNKEFI